MSRGKRKMLVADLLCGAGGSSTGCRRALAELGLEMELVCVNHWPTAIDTHQRNHPEARHYVQDIATARPHLLVPEGYLDLLMASPTCTYFSVARGGKPTSDQQRSDPWHIITWLTELRVKRVIIENVWEFIHWGPVNARTGKPIKSRKGEYFHAWIETIKRLGFEPEWRKLNAADYGDATTRQRFILMARSDRKTVHWPMQAYRKRSAIGAELFPDAKPWKPAREIIDWSIKGKSIFNRKKPLAPKTLARIHAGAVKFGWPEPFLVVLRNHMSAQGLDVPIPTIAASGNHIGLAEPVIISPRHGKEGAGPRPRPVADPLPTITAGGSQVAVAEPVILSQHNSGAPRSADDPLPTITTGGAASEQRQGCARPMLVTVAHGNDPRERDPNSRRAHNVEDPLGTVHGDGSAYAVVEPFVLSQASGGSPRPVSEPIPTAPTGGAHALIAPYYGSGSGETCKPADEPLDSIRTKSHLGMVVPVTHSKGGNNARDVADPIPTLTTAKGGEFALCEPSDEFDILFRMLEPHELAAAMGFNDEDRAYEFAGTKTEQIKQIGNAVSVAKMKACVSAIMADAAPPVSEESAFREAAE
ncbi:DNA cytosine methyltransferase [Oricola sp.]|uniref:DNA cytosine methyltransferase n=1 Tax=Oricola sp. TaxID=1979950 RepID=UPI003BACF3FC